MLEEPLSPELALVDPDLARRARALLVEIESAEPAEAPHPHAVDRPAIEHRASRATPSMADRAFRLGAWLAVPSILLNVALVRERPGEVKQSPPAVSAPGAARSPGASSPAADPKRVAESRQLRRHATRPPARARKGVAGAVLGAEKVPHPAAKVGVRRHEAHPAIRTLTWSPIERVVRYDVIIWHGHRRIADIWVRRPALEIKRLACGDGRRLAPGRYLWFVYPVVASPRRHFGPLVRSGTVSFGAAECPPGH